MWKDEKDIDEPFEAAFARLIARRKADPLKSKLEKLHILSRELFLLAEDDLMTDKDLQPMKALIKVLKRDLGTFQALLDADVSFPDEAADRVCARWPTLTALRNSTWKVVESELSRAEDGDKNVGKAPQELIDRVRQIHAKKHSKGDIKEAEEEVKKKREKAKLDRAYMKEMLDALKDLPGADAASKMEAFEKKFPEKMKELRERGVLGDGSKLEELIKDEMGQLDKTLTDLGAVSASLENIAARVDGGNLLRGLFLSKNGLRHGEALVLAADDNAYTAHNPSAPSEISITHFKSTTEYEKIQSLARVTGWSTAVAFSGSFVLSVDTAVSYETSTSEKTVDVNQTRTKTLVVTRQLSLPTLCLNFEQSALRLCQAALRSLKQVGDRSTARAFLHKYGSHVLTGEVTVGGRLEFVFQARSEEAATVREFLRLESEKFSSKVNVSGLSFGMESSYARSESKEQAERTKNFREDCITTTELKAYGPPVSDLGVFIKTVNANACYWYVLSRGCPSCRLAVWDIARQHDELSDDLDFQSSVDMVELAWRTETGLNGNPLLWQATASSTSSLDKQQGELSEWLLYVCRHGVSAQLHSMRERAVAFCDNVQRGVDYFDNADFLGDILISRNASTNPVVIFLRAVAASSDNEAKACLAQLLSGHLGRVIRQSFSDPENILQALNLPPVEKPVDCPPIRNVACTKGRVNWNRAGGALGYEVQMAGPYDYDKKNQAEAEAKEGDYQSVYQGSETSWICSKLTNDGVYRFRVRGRYDLGWGDFSPSISFLYADTTASHMWDIRKKTPGVSLSTEGDCLLRVAAHTGTDNTWHSAQSVRPLLTGPLLPEAWPYSSVRSFEVKVDHLARRTFVGLCRASPLSSKAVGADKGYGVAIEDNGCVWNDGANLSRGDQCNPGDVLRVEVDFTIHLVSFFKNSKRQGDPVILSEQDRNQPLYATVSMVGQKSQVALL